jgi:MFS family permease
MSGTMAGGMTLKSADSRGAALREWREGWPVILAGFAGFFLLSLGNLSMGAFMIPVTTDLHWSHSQYTSGLFTYAPAGIVMGPLVGALIDKWGVRPIVVIGSLLVAVTFSLFAIATSAISLWLVLWLLYAVANQLIMMTAWTAAVARVFNASRGLAMAITWGGSAAAGFVAPLVADLLIRHEGWRTAYVVMGLGTGCAVALICWFALDGGSSAPPAAQAQPESVSATPAGGDTRSMTTGEALRSFAFIKLGIAMFIANFVPLALTVHFIPLLSAGGLSDRSAVVIGGSFALVMFPGQLIGGIAFDYISARLVAAIGFTIMIAGLAMLMLPVHPIGVPIAGVLLCGFAMGALSPLFPYLTSRYFGLESFGRLFGVLSALSALAFATGPYAASKVFDLTSPHSYRLFLAGSIPAILLTILLIVSLGRDPGSGDTKAP